MSVMVGSPLLVWALILVAIDRFGCKRLSMLLVGLSMTCIGICRITPAKPLAVPLGGNMSNRVLSVGVRSLRRLRNVRFDNILV